MDIAVYVTQALVLVAAGLMAGCLYAETRQRRQAEKSIADALETVRRGREEAMAEVQKLVQAINAAHNGQATQLQEMRGLVESLSNRVTTIAAGRPGPTHGGTQIRPPTRPQG